MLNQFGEPHRLDTLLAQTSGGAVATLSRLFKKKKTLLPTSNVFFVNGGVETDSVFPLLFDSRNSHSKLRPREETRRGEEEVEQIERKKRRKSPERKCQSQPPDSQRLRSPEFAPCCPPPQSLSPKGLIYSTRRGRRSRRSEQSTGVRKGAEDSGATATARAGPGASRCLVPSRSLRRSPQPRPRPSSSTSLTRTKWPWSPQGLDLVLALDITSNSSSSSSSTSAAMGTGLPAAE